MGKHFSRDAEEEEGGGVMAVNNEEMVYVLWWGPFVEMTIVARSPRAAHRCPE